MTFCRHRQSVAKTNLASYILPVYLKFQYSQLIVLAHINNEQVNQKVPGIKINRFNGIPMNTPIVNSFCRA